ncbi:MAG: glyoxalase [Gammaproteobacteria bacterium]|jgi:uncharacterized glyoxalase superfamily protein PhnB|nr:glyoxalase [Gammaproteobacteria bacterium]
MSVKPIPEGFHTITPFLVVENAQGFLKFLQEGLGAKIQDCFELDNTIKHACAQVGDSMLMFADASEHHPAAPGGMFYLYVEDCDAWYHRALKAGATSTMEPADQFYGDRHSGVKDAWGNSWWFATHIEDVSDEEMEKRVAQYKCQ